MDRTAMFLQFAAGDGLESSPSEHVLHLLTTTSKSRHLLTTKRKRARFQSKNIFQVTVSRYSEDQFKQHFCMSKSTFEILLHAIGHHTKQSGGPPPIEKIPLQKMVLCTIWLLSKQESFPAVADRFDVPKSSAHKIFGFVVHILSALLPQHVQWPCAAKQPISSQMFKVRSHGITGIVGVIDECYIPIEEPAKDAHDYLRNNQFHAIILQAVCDSWGRFVDVYVGMPGGMQAAHAFRSSPLFMKLTDEQNPLLRRDQHLVGDSAYPLLMHLMTPFKDTGQLLPGQSRYNNRLGKIRSIVERTFDMLKKKFKRLIYLDITDVDLGTNIIAAACMLHNFIFNNGDMDELNLRDVTSNLPYFADEENAPEDRPTEAAIQKRDDIALNL